MVISNEIDEAFQRIDNYIKKNNYELIVPVIDSIMLNNYESYLYIDNNENDETYYII